MSCRGKCNKGGCHTGGAKVLCCTARARRFEELKGWEIWELPPETRLVKSYNFKDFAEALNFVNKVGVIAEKINHHPNIQLEWGKVGVDIWTHAVNDLTELDFVLAKEIDCIK
jgi:pterin-4a-carbinolamine dehydratase